MNSEYEQNDMDATSLEALTRINGQAVETRRRIPYEVTVYAIPEQWREEEVKMLRAAVEFQPTLYRLIGKLATRQDWQNLMNLQRGVLQTNGRELEESLRSTLRQDGSVREKYFSEISKLLSDSLKSMEAATLRLEQKIRRLTMLSVAASTIMSALVCAVLYLLAG